VSLSLLSPASRENSVFLSRNVTFFVMVWREDSSSTYSPLLFRVFYLCLSDSFFALSDLVTPLFGTCLPFDESGGFGFSSQLG